ncbi:MAG: hypothetical protein ABIH41_00980 [Nanoarchaeota archaeon]
MDCRGEGRKLWLIAFEIIALAVIGLAFMLKVQDITQDTTYWRLYYTKDHALLINTMHAADGDVTLNYDMAKSARLFDYELLADRVQMSVYSPRGQSKLSTYHRFATDTLNTIVPARMQPVSITFSRSDTDITIKEGLVSQDACTNLRAERTLPFKILILSPETGLSGAVQEADMVGPVAANLRSRWQSKEVQRYDAAFILRFSMHEDDINDLRVLYPADSPLSESIACHLVKKMRETLPDLFSSYVEMPLRAYDQAILGEDLRDTPVILIEAGSVKDPQTAWQQRRFQAADIIYTTIEEAYG